MPFLIKIVTWQIPSLSSIQGKDRTIEKERMAGCRPIVVKKKMG